MALGQLLNLGPDADRRVIETAFTEFMGAVRGDANRLETQDLAGFEQKINSLFDALERASSAPAVPEIIGGSLRGIPQIVKGFLAGTASMGSIEGLKAGAAQEWYTRRIVDTLESLAKKADEYRIEKSLSELGRQEEDLTDKADELIGGGVIRTEEGSREYELIKDKLDDIQKRREKLEEERLLQDEAMLIEYGLRYFRSRFSAEENAALGARLQALREGSTAERSQIMRPIELKLAGLMAEAHKNLEKEARDLEAEFLEQEWRGQKGATPALKEKSSEFFNAIYALYSGDIWAEWRKEDATERNRILGMPEDLRALETIYKIDQRPPTFLRYRRWLPLPFHPNNKVFLERARESLLIDVTKEKVRQFVANPDMEARVRSYQESIAGLRPYLETFIGALNQVRRERGEENINLNTIDRADRNEVMLAISLSRMNIDEVFAILQTAKEALGRTPVVESAKMEVERVYPSLQITAEDRTRWNEQIIRNILREIDGIEYKIRTGGREIWARSTLAGILRNPQTARENYRQRIPEEGDPARELWETILSESTLEQLLRDDAGRRSYMAELDNQVKRLRNERPALERERDRLMSIAGRYQELVSARGGRGVLAQRGERQSARAAERVEKGKERRARGGGEREQWEFAPAPSEKERALRGEEAWRARETESTREVPEALRSELAEIKDAILGLRKMKEARGDFSDEEGGKFDLLLLQADNINRLKNESAFRREMRSFRKHLETAGLDEISQQELDRRLRLIAAAEGRLKGSKLFGEGKTEEVAPEKGGKKNKKGKKGKSKQDMREGKKAALDEKFEPRQKKGKQQREEERKKRK